MSVLFLTFLTPMVASYHLGLSTFPLYRQLPAVQIFFLVLWIYPSSVCYLVFHQIFQRKWLIPSSFRFTGFPHVDNSFNIHRVLLPCMRTLGLDSTIPAFVISPIMQIGGPAVPGLLLLFSLFWPRATHSRGHSEWSRVVSPLASVAWKLWLDVVH